MPPEVLLDSRQTDSVDRLLLLRRGGTTNAYFQSARACCRSLLLRLDSLTLTARTTRMWRLRAGGVTDADDGVIDADEAPTGVGEDGRLIVVGLALARKPRPLPGPPGQAVT